MSTGVKNNNIIIRPIIIYYAALNAPGVGHKDDELQAYCHISQIVARTGSYAECGVYKRYGVRPPVRSSVCRFAAVGPTGSRYRSCRSSTDLGLPAARRCRCRSKGQTDGPYRNIDVDRYSAIGIANLQ